MQQYDANVAAGIIRSDDYQRKMLGSLNQVYEDLVNYHPEPVKRPGLLSKFFGSNSSATEVGPKGIYMYGDVGCGKTMLMDMFYTTVPSHLTKKRTHFHAFMQGVHKDAHALKQKHGLSFSPSDEIAHFIAQESTVLCLDEIQVTDVADAMILRSLFESLYKRGVVTFFTSNRKPRDLYKHGVQRESFLPCIDLFEERNHVVYLKSPTDYRKIERPQSGCYYFWQDNLTEQENRDLAVQHSKRWFDFFSEGATPVENRDLEIWGRPVAIPKSAGNKVMQFTFKELCGTYRSAADYLEMCKTFPAAVITDIPELSLEQTDLVRRFITFLDAAYDSHLKLAAEARRPFDKLFNTQHLTIDPTTNEVVLKADSLDVPVLNIKNFTGAEEMFAFARALSRLKQMSSNQWLDFKR